MVDANLHRTPREFVPEARRTLATILTFLLPKGCLIRTAQVRERKKADVLSRLFFRLPLVLPFVLPFMWYLSRRFFSWFVDVSSLYTSIPVYVRTKSRDRYFRGSRDCSLLCFPSHRAGFAKIKES